MLLRHQVDLYYPKNLLLKAMRGLNHEITELLMLSEHFEKAPNVPGSEITDDHDIHSEYIRMLLSLFKSKKTTDPEHRLKKLIQRLIDCGFDINRPLGAVNKGTIIYHFLKTPYTSIVESLIEQGAHFDEISDTICEIAKHPQSAILYTPQMISMLNKYKDRMSEEAKKYYNHIRLSFLLK